MKVQSMFRLVIEDKDEKIFTHKNVFIQNLQVKCNCESNLQNIPDFPIMHTALCNGGKWAHHIKNNSETSSSTHYNCTLYI